MITNSKYPKLFISHSHDDKNIAYALINYLTTAYELDKTDIRCSSHADYMTRIGITTENLREDLFKCEGIIALLSYTGVHSSWVKYELGAAWVMNKPIIPIVGPRNERFEKHYGPIKGFRHIYINNIHCEKMLIADIKDLLDKIGIKSRIDSRRNNDRIRSFVKKFRYDGGHIPDFSKAIVKIIEPSERSIIEKKFDVRVLVNNLPRDSSIWIVMASMKTNNIWPKKCYNYLQTDDGFSSLKFSELNSSNTELGIWIIGVGTAGNRIIEQWLHDSERTNNYNTLYLKDIPCIPLDKADFLTIQ
jgi:hypothetical protein